MFDDLRKNTSFDEDEEEPVLEAAPPPAKTRHKKRPAESETPVLGMTAIQRLIIAFMLFLNVSVLGCFFLLATQAVWLPF
jgi:hypothetical protein